MNLRQIVIVVAVANIAYFGIEFTVALAIGSVSLFADSIDFLEDASVNLLIAVGLGWSATGRARLGMALAGLLLVPGLATLWTAWSKFLAPSPPRRIRIQAARVHGRCSMPPASNERALQVAGPDAAVHSARRDTSGSF